MPLTYEPGLYSLSSWLCLSFSPCKVHIYSWHCVYTYIYMAGWQAHFQEYRMTIFCFKTLCLMFQRIANVLNDFTATPVRTNHQGWMLWCRLAIPARGARGVRDRAGLASSAQRDPVCDLSSTYVHIYVHYIKSISQSSQRILWSLEAPFRACSEYIHG